MNVRAVLLDLQGVLYEAGTPFPGAREAVEQMAASTAAIIMPPITPGSSSAATRGRTAPSVTK